MHILPEFPHLPEVPETKDKKSISQLALWSLILAIMALPLAGTAMQTCGYPHVSIYLVVLAIVLGHSAFFDRKHDYSLAIRALLLGYFVLATVVTIAVVKWGTPDLWKMLQWPGWSPPADVCP